MLTPAYKVTFGHTVVDTTDKAQASTVVDLEVELDIETPADSFRLVLGQVGGKQPARGDPVTIAVGYADNGILNQVMVATATTVERSLTTTRVVGYSVVSALLSGYNSCNYRARPREPYAGRGGQDR
jgi:hypothetical protein